MATESKSTYSTEFIPSIVRWGCATNVIGVIFAFLPAIVCTVFYGLWPGWGPIIAGTIMQVSVSGVFWFVEPISYFSILGIPGTYMSFLSGNIGNLRLPATVAAQQAANVEPGTEQGTIIATIGVATSIIVNVVLLTIGVMLGAQVLSMLPANVTRALANLLPALFAAMVGQGLVGNPKVGIVGVVIAAVMLTIVKLGFLDFLPGAGHPAYVVPIVSVFGTIFIGQKIKAAEKAKGQ